MKNSNDSIKKVKRSTLRKIADQAGEYSQIVEDAIRGLKPWYKKYKFYELVDLYTLRDFLEAVNEWQHVTNEKELNKAYYKATRLYPSFCEVHEILPMSFIKRFDYFRYYVMDSNMLNKRVVDDLP